MPYNLVRAFWAWESRSNHERKFPGKIAAGPPSAEVVYSYGAALAFLEGLGFESDRVRAMSMPEESLQFCCRHLDGSAPLRGLHVGYYLGVSACYFAAHIKAVHADSRLMSLDANLSDVYVTNPAETVARLLYAFGLQSHVLVLLGYSLDSTGPDAAIRFEPQRPLQPMPTERRPDRQLEALRHLGVTEFDFALLDGSHAAAYVQRELDAVHPLLKRNGLLFLDDASEAWPALKRLFEDATSRGYEILGSDGRVGVLRTRSSS